MDFCSSCGILLSLDLIGEPYCQPCANEHRNRTSGINEICQCDFCGKARPRPPQIHNQSNFPSSSSHKFKSPIPVANPKESKKGRKKSKAGNVKRKMSRYDECQDHVLNSSHSSADTCFADHSQTHTLPKESSDVFDDWGQLATQSWAVGDQWWDEPPEDGFFANTHDKTTPDCPGKEENFTSSVFRNSNSYKKIPDWTVDSKKKEHFSSTLFGSHDFPGLGEEQCVLQRVKEGWEREQEEYKRRLEVADTPIIKRLVFGERRNHIGQRFHIGGVDISFIKDNNVDACACLSIIRMPDLELVYQRMETIKLTQPYIPGFLAFREVPPLFDLFVKLKDEAPQYIPDVVMVDGNGILHPKGFGLASQLGVILDIPTIGVAKTLMCAQGIVDDNEHKAKKPSLVEAGDGFDLIADSGQILGKCLRVHDNAPNPIYVSVGHKVTLKSAVWIVLECSKYRIPEPVRRADLDSREYIRQGKKEPSVFIL